MTSPTKHLNLDVVDDSEIEIVLTLNKKQHKLADATVASYIQMLKDMEAVPLNPTALQETELAIGMIMRNFPTMPREDLEGLKLSQLRKIQDFMMDASGQNVKKAAKDAGGNGEAANG